jgi:parvulin-like peptidyl-prolyl isomerase
MSDRIRASHILIMHADSERSTATRSKDEARQTIDEVKAELDGGADFADVAEARSDCSSASRGGDLGLFGRGAMVPEFEDAAFGLEVGDDSAVVETAFGYHLIRRTE